MRKRAGSDAEDSPTNNETSDEEAPLPATCVVLQVAANTPKITLEWLMLKIKAKRQDGGGELIVMKQVTSPDEDYIFHISASKIKCLEVAEEIEMIKSDKYGQSKEFLVSELEEFLYEGFNVDDLFTLAEKQAIVRHELEHMRAMKYEPTIPGLEKPIKLYEGQSILHALQKNDIVTKMYPLHDQEELKKLGKQWYLGLTKETRITEEVRLYFGESIALYFYFLSYYTKSLIVPMVLGFIQVFLLSQETWMIFFCAFNVVWVTLFLELWKRKSSELAFQWGTIGMTSLDEPRPYFRGTMGVDAVTGKILPQSPRYMTTIKMYTVSLPVVLLCMVAAFFIMLFSFWAEDYIKQCDESYQQLILLPSIVYTIIVLIINAYYRKLATYLTEWENHRTQSQFERHRVTKLVLLEFVNSFMSLFYIAFIIKDVDMLRSQVQTMFITSQAVNKLTEVLVPLIMKYYFTKVKQISIRRRSLVKPQIHPLLEGLRVPQISNDDPRAQQAIFEGEMEQYEDTFDDYLELFVQFGFAFLFSSVYPLAAFWAVLNNILEIREDAFKLCTIYQRPFTRKVKDIGAWQRAFEIMSGISIMTNCGLLYMSPKIRNTVPSFTEIQWLLIFVALEHILLGIRFLLHIAISDKPEWVRVALAKRNYLSKKAFKYERTKRNQQFLRKKFKTVHGSRANS